MNQRPTKPLCLHEEIMLLALHDEKGTVFSGTWHSIALGTAVISELLMQNRIEIQQERKKKFINVVSDKPTNDEVLDEGLAKIANAKRRATIQTWVSRMAMLKNMRHRVAMQLADKKILRADEKQILLFFRQKVYPERDGKPEKEIISRLHNAIFRNKGTDDPRTIVLLALSNSCGLLRNLFDKKKLKQKKKHIAELAEGNTLGDAAQAAVDGAQAAIMAAAIIPAITTTTVITSG